jgi:hypothetical protein
MFLPNSILIALLTASSAFALGTTRASFVWNDINTRVVVRWEGDVAVIQQGSSMKELSCRIKLNDSEVTFAIESFGIPKSWTSYTYRTDKELAEKQARIRKDAGKHGIKMHTDGNHFSVDYDWVIGKSTQKLRDVAKTIRSCARRKGYRTKRELVGAFTSFVQSLTYRIPPDSRVNAEGEQILTAGAMMPIETLSKKWGDCDSKCMLFASLVKAIDLVEVCFIVMDDHLFAAVQMRSEQEDHTVRYKNKDWILIELTDAWPIGRVPSNHLSGVILGKYEVVDLQ